MVGESDDARTAPTKNSVLALNDAGQFRLFTSSHPQPSRAANMAWFRLPFSATRQLVWGPTDLSAPKMLTREAHGSLS